MKKKQQFLKFKQPSGLKVILYVTFLLFLGVLPATIMVLQYVEKSNIHTNPIFIVFLASIFGCFLGYIIGFHRSIIYSMIYAILGIVISQISNLQLVGLFVYIVGVGVALPNLQLAMSSFFVSIDKRKTIASTLFLICFFSSCLIGRVLQNKILASDQYIANLLFLFLTILIFCFYTTNSYKLNTYENDISGKYTLSHSSIFILLIIMTIIFFVTFNDQEIVYVMIALVIFSILSTIYLFYKGNKKSPSTFFFMIYTLVGVFLGRVLLLEIVRRQLNVTNIFYDQFFWHGLIVINITLIAVYILFKLKILKVNIKNILDSWLCRIVMTLIAVRLVFMFLIILNILPFPNLYFQQIYIYLGYVMIGMIAPIYLIITKENGGSGFEILNTINIYIIFTFILIQY